MSNTDGTANQNQEQLENYDRMTRFLEQHGLLSNAAEVHGIVSGMIAGSASIEGDEWLLLLSDLIHEGQTFPVAVSTTLHDFARQTHTAFRDPDLGYQLLLPGDHQPLQDRLQAMVAWVQSFLVGFGVNQTNLAALSADVREAIDDMVEIAKLELTVDDEEEGERAYFEIIEYLRISALLAFNELGQKPTKPTTTTKTLH